MHALRARIGTKELSELAVAGLGQRHAVLLGNHGAIAVGPDLDVAIHRAREPMSLIHSGSDARFLLLGGRFVSGETLLRFYVLHCVAIPLAAALLIAVHFCARPQGRRHQRPVVIATRTWTANGAVSS